jgi:MFS family permease
MSDEVFEYKDRKVGLIVFGIVQIIIGACCALAVPMMLFGVIAAEASGQESGFGLRAMIPGILVYVFAAIAFIWLGMGSIMARRWARALLLVFSSIMFICGLLGSLVAAIFMKDMFVASMSQQEGLSPDVRAFVMTVMAGFMVVIYGVIPGAHILFYRSPHVRATCEARDAKERWTDRSPLSVIALCALVLVWGTGQLTMVGYHFAIPFFGQIISGPAGASVVMLIAGLSIWLTIGLYRLREPAWWGTLAAIIVYALSTITTFLRVDMMDYYEIMGLPTEQLELMGTASMLTGASMIAMVAFYLAPFLSLMMFVRKHFMPKD